MDTRCVETSREVVESTIVYANSHPRLTKQEVAMIEVAISLKVDVLVNSSYEDFDGNLRVGKIIKLYPRYSVDVEGCGFFEGPMMIDLKCPLFSKLRQSKLFSLAAR